MKKGGRYDVSGQMEAQWEPGSNDQVLKNRAGIKSTSEMDDAEARALEKAMREFVGRYDEHHRFTAADLREMHKAWLGDIYEWAGKYRQVNVSKDGFMFAFAARIPSLMSQFEGDVLRRNTPCRFQERPAVVSALAETHVELVLIHPFREGNGRLVRSLSNLMALQAGMPLLNFSVLAEERRLEYFSAVQAGLDKNYVPMEKLFDVIINQS